MNIRQLFINTLCFTIVGVVLSISGIGVLTWKYWAVILCMVGIMINLAFD